MPENPFDGMTTRAAVGLTGRLMNCEQKHGQRWNNTVRDRQNSVDLVNRVIDDDNENMGNRVKCVELQIKMEAQNQTDERVQLLIGERGSEEPQVILILPNNGSEIQNLEDGEVEEQDSQEVEME